MDALPKNQRPTFPRFKGDLTVPVVVVGGGLTGCATAWGLAAAGVGVVLVEAERLAVEATGHGSGLMRADAASSYLAFEKAHGRRAARAVFASTATAAKELAATAKRLGIKPPVAPHDALLMARGRDEEKSLRREMAARETAGLAAPWLKPPMVRRETGLDTAGALRVRDWAQADPFRLALGFAAAAAKRKAAIFEGSPVRKLRVGRDAITLTLPGGTITADTVIVCTGAPTELHRPLQRHFKVDERYVVVTEPVPALMRRAFGRRSGVLVDGGAPPLALWWTKDDRLVMAGADQPRTPEKGRDKVWVQRTGQLMYDVLRMYPAISGLRPAFGWDSPVTRSADDVMVVGAHRNFPRQLFAWGSDHDPAHAYLASRILVRHVRGETGTADRFFSFTRG